MLALLSLGPFTPYPQVLAVTLSPPEEGLSLMPEVVLMDGLGVGMQPWMACGGRVKVAADLDDFGSLLAAGMTEG